MDSNWLSECEYFLNWRINFYIKVIKFKYFLKYIFSNYRVYWFKRICVCEEEKDIYERFILIFLFIVDKFFLDFDEFGE